MYIDNSEPSENVGQIHFSLEYDFQNTTLILRILTVSGARTHAHTHTQVYTRRIFLMWDNQFAVCVMGLTNVVKQVNFL